MTQYPNDIRNDINNDIKVYIAKHTALGYFQILLKAQFPINIICESTQIINQLSDYITYQ